MGTSGVDVYGSQWSTRLVQWTYMGTRRVDAAPLLIIREHQSLHISGTEHKGAL